MLESAAGAETLQLRANSQRQVRTAQGVTIQTSQGQRGREASSYIKGPRWAQTRPGRCAVVALAFTCSKRQGMRCGGAPSSVQRRPVERNHCRLSGARRALTGEARAGTGEAAGQVAVENARNNGSGGARKPVAQWATKRGRILALGRIIGETGVDHREAARMGRRRDWRGSESRCGALMLAWAAS